MTLKVAIVGCGKIADGHVEQIREMPDMARVIAACDLELLMAEQLAARYGIPAHYDDFERLLAVEKPDVVHITTPPGSHLALTTRALEAGCHVYVEKPLTPTLAETRTLVERAQAAGRRLTVGYTYLFDPPALAMRELIAAGEIGEPVHVESFYGYDLAGQFGSALLADANHWVHRLPGRLLHNNIDHLFNKMVEFIDDERPALLAQGFVRRTARFGDARDDMHDELRVMVSGAKVTAYGTFSAHVRPAPHFCRVYGTKNTVTVDYLARTVLLEGTSQLPSAIGRLVPAFERAGRFAGQGMKNLAKFARADFHFFAGLSHLIRAYYRSILDGGPPPIPYRDMVAVAAMMEEVFTQIGATAAPPRPPP
ncbi:MAG: Gfo/Idh/MocA family oxidoreductase [Polyangiaceae bacterium]